jgi:hypothetical protein
LMQTVQITSQKLLADGAGHTFPPNECCALMCVESSIAFQ